MTKLSIIVLCALFGVAIAQHGSWSRSWSSSSATNPEEMVPPVKAPVSGLGKSVGQVAVNPNAAFKLAVGIPDRFSTDPKVGNADGSVKYGYYSGASDKSQQIKDPQPPINFAHGGVKSDERYGFQNGGYSQPSKGSLVDVKHTAASVPNPASTFVADSIKFIKIGQKYYWIDITHKMNWHAAHHLCRRNNAQLATITSDEELRALNAFLIGNKVTNKLFWLAGNDLAEETKFRWVSNGQTMTYEKWSPGQPDNWSGNENCVGLWTYKGVYLMNDANCAHDLNVICEVDTSCMYKRRRQ